MEIKFIIWDEEKYCFFTSGHVDRLEFFSAAMESMKREVGDSIKEPSASAIEYAWFRMMSPTEARRAGYDFGYILADPPSERRRGGPFPVTLVVL